MDKHILRRDGDRDIEFSGRLIAEVLGSPGVKWTELRLYRTSSGKYLLARDQRTDKVSQHDKHEVWTLSSAEAVVTQLQEFGMGRLSKELLRIAAEVDPPLAMHVNEREWDVELLEATGDNFFEAWDPIPDPPPAELKQIRVSVPNGQAWDGREIPQDNPHFRADFTRASLNTVERKAVYRRKA